MGEPSSSWEEGTLLNAARTSRLSSGICATGQSKTRVIHARVEVGSSGGEAHAWTGVRPHVFAGKAKVVCAEDDSVALLLLAVMRLPLFTRVCTAVLAVAGEGTPTDISLVARIPLTTHDEPSLLISLR